MTDLFSRSIVLFFVGCVLSVLSESSQAFAQPTVSATPPSPVKPRLAGMIMDPSGAPAPDVQLFWQAVTFVDRRPVYFVEGRSEADGSFKLTPSSERLSYLGGRPYGHLWIVAPNHAIQVCEAREFLVQGGKPAKTLTLKNFKPVNCQLLGPDVLPRAGELMEPEAIRLDGREYQVPPRLREVLGGVTDVDGQWQMNHLDESSTMRVRVVSESYGRQFQQWWPDLASRDFSIRMAPTGSIEGQIVGVDLHRFEGVPVQVRSNATRQVVQARDRDVAAPVYFDTGEATTLVDREGRFRIPAIAAGEVIVVLRNPSESEWVTESRPSFKLKEGETGKISFASTRKVGFEGKVELSDGSPAAGVRVEATSGRNWPIGNAVTGVDGRFQCLVCPGKVTTTAYLPSFAGLQVISRSVTASNVTVVPGGSKNAVVETLRLPEVALVEGRVVDETGESIADCTVNIERRPDSYHRLKAGSDGRFRVYRPAKVEFKEYRVKVDGQPAVILEKPGQPTLIRVEG